MDLESMMAAQGGGGGAPAGPQDDGKLLDLGPKIETQSCYAKNVDTRFPMTNLFIGDTRLGCKSDADEQLILHIAFQEFVKVCGHVFVVHGFVLLVGLTHTTRSGLSFKKRGPLAELS